MNTHRLATVSMLVLATIASAPAQAQQYGSFIFTPYIGVYVPSTDIARVGVAANGASIDASIKHQSAFGAGATMSYWLNDRMAIETGVAYSSSDARTSLRSSGTGGFEVQSGLDHANVWLVNTKLMVQLLPPETGLNLRFGVGPAIITRNGSFYDQPDGKVTGLTNVGGAVSLCTRIPLTSALAIRMRGEDFIYKSKLGFTSSVDPTDNFSFNSRLQNDFIFSAGLQFFLNR